MTSSYLRGRPFYCREWALQRLQHCLEGLSGTRAPGILITGAPGAGKTALCTEILWPTSEAGRASRLSCRVLAYHFCQAHTHPSLDPLHFIQNLAKQLQTSPLISGYKGGSDSATCRGDLHEIFKRTVLAPLAELPLPSQNLLLLVDSVDETCCCCPSHGFSGDAGCTIAELLAAHHELLPPWLLLVCSARRQNKAITRMFTGFRRLCLDDLRKAHIVRDVQQYILCRLDCEAALRQHLTLDTAEMLNQLHIKSNGCFLFLERVLDGVSAGSILLREIRHIPGTLNGLYLWLCQRLFSGRRFCLVRTLLNVILASPVPLSPSQLHKAVWTKQMKGWSTEEFTKVLSSMSMLLHPLDSAQVVPFHHSFSEWVLDVKYCTQKYLCNVTEGHCMLAMSLSTRAPNLQPAEVSQLAKHLLLSDIRALEPCHLALWLLWTDAPVSDCLASNVSLELEVLQLLLLAREKVDPDSIVEDTSTLKRTLERGVSLEVLLETGGGLNQRDRFGRTLLAAAAQAGDLDAVKLMLSRGASLEVTDEDGQTPLGLAAHQGHLPVVELLLEHGAQHDHSDSRGWTALRAAAWGGHTEVVESLLAFGAQPDISGPDGRTALRAAAWGGHEGPVKALVRAGAEIDHADVEGRTPLMAAAYMSHFTVAELLLESGANVNACDLEGRSALAVACLCIPTGQRHPQLVSVLLERGADPQLEDKEGLTPLLVAAYEGQDEVAELLLEAGADPDRPGKDQMTPLLAAASGGHAETVRVLLLWGASTDVTDQEGRSALLLAAAAARGEEAVRVLLHRGLNEIHQDHLGWTALHWAASEGRRAVCRTLIDGGAKLGLRNREGYTPLLLAAEEGHTGCIELLINRGSPIDQRGRDGMTALCFAALSGHKATVELLLRKGADPDVKTTQGKPLLHLLALQGLTDIAKVLLEQGADLESRDPEERTALHASCWQGDLDMVHLLLEVGRANCNAFDQENRTPLHCAAWRGQANIAQLLIERGAFSDAQCSQGATPLCIAAQEGHHAVARVLLEEGNASPFHSDYYGRTPIKVAAKGGHIAIVHLLEAHGVPSYQGPMVKAPLKDACAAERADGGGDSWSTLSPVSTGSRSLDNSLKSSAGSMMTSSTYHSQATVPIDSLTFTQQVQQHSLPRSRSRQAVAFSTMVGFPGVMGSSSPGLLLDHGEVITRANQNMSSPDREIKRNGILTNPKYGSPTYTRFRPSDNAHPVDNTRPKDYNQSKSSSSGYSSSHATGENHHKHVINSPKKVKNIMDQRSKVSGSPVHSPQNSNDPTPFSVTTVDPKKKASNLVTSPKPKEDYVHSTKNPVDFVYCGGISGDIVHSHSKKDPQSSPTQGDQDCSRGKQGSPVISITTMDPQLHLKQAIKLQFEGRTCGFNYRKETPL
ncbi:ankyrin repeat domain-containing protein 50-like [Bufo gargarizans]|uniref:ankyrin repeat domain-containing protein 50-like n=1 Tax=Bufo gargarizans TaxID=30331 RepID=UPI001CF53730|nr:ankyrin repeat domain-containing protein 50-like [Bufo gargarizans]